MEWSVLLMKKQNEVCFQIYDSNNTKFFDKYVYNSMIGLVVGFHSEDKVNSSYTIIQYTKTDDNTFIMKENYTFNVN